MADRFLYKTKSVCPVCLKKIYADIVSRDGGIYMDKSCAEHGSFSTLIWADSAENYLRWLEYGGMDVNGLPQNEEEADKATGGKGFACEACQLPASSALMTTNRCNMNCPVCFTRDKNEPLHEPSLEECKALMKRYKELAGDDALIEFCGGEPTVRKDICDLTNAARTIGFDYIQLNTNGIELAKNKDLARALRFCGLTTVYLGFDGMSDKPYYAKYGKPMLDIKKKAVENCANAGLAVVLVCCVIPGENDGELGQIIEYAKQNMPTVKGVYLQPISYFGIYPHDKVRRITIPDVIRRLDEQCGDISARDFGPGAYDHAQCSFNACYMLGKDGRLKALTRFSKREREENAVHRLRKNMRATWMPSQNKMLTVGGMAFQDNSNIDLMRVQRCSIQIIQRDGRMIPLCSKYLSSCDGHKIFDGIG